MDILVRTVSFDSRTVTEEAGGQGAGGRGSVGSVGSVESVGGLTINYQLPTTNYQLPTVNRQPTPEK
ncbi:MAG: hypothetical protein QNJ36_04260 [Calothrix sp. MO_167.B42]|nr:hypothetical protein [Calothrix sp. MO_167.B42]